MLVKDWTSYIFTYTGGNAALTLPLDADDEDKAQHPPLLLDDDATDTLESGRHAGPIPSRSTRTDEDDKGL